MSDTVHGSQVVLETADTSVTVRATQTVAEVPATSITNRASQVVSEVAAVSIEARASQVVAVVATTIPAPVNPVPVPPIWPNPGPYSLFGYSIHKKPTFASLAPPPGRSGREALNFQMPVPLWEFELVNEILRDQTQNITLDPYFSGFNEYSQLLGLFLAAAGQYGFFFFEDITDNSRSLQPIATADGATTIFPFVRTMSYGTIAYTEPVGGVNITQPIVVTLNGTPVPSLGNWGVSHDQSSLVFLSPPAAGVLIRSTFYYYYLCRFITDDQPFEEFLHNRWFAKPIRFRSVSRLGMNVVDPLIFP